MNNRGAVVIFVLVGIVVGAFAVFVGHLNHPGHVGVVQTSK